MHAYKHTYMHQVVHGSSALGRWYENLMLLLIVANCGGFIYGSQAHVAADTELGQALDLLEDVCVLAFTVDYVLRLYAAGCHAEYAGWGRVRYLTRFYPLVDLAAIAPSLLGRFGPMLGVPAPDVNTSFIRALRLLRRLRKLAAVRGRWGNNGNYPQRAPTAPFRGGGLCRAVFRPTFACGL